MKYKSILLVLIGLFIVSHVELYAQDTPPEKPVDSHTSYQLGGCALPVMTKTLVT